MTSATRSTSRSSPSSSRYPTSPETNQPVRVGPAAAVRPVAGEQGVAAQRDAADLAGVRRHGVQRVGWRVVVHRPCLRLGDQVSAVRADDPQLDAVDGSADGTVPWRRRHQGAGRHRRRLGQAVALPHRLAHDRADFGEVRRVERGGPRGQDAHRAEGLARRRRWRAGGGRSRVSRGPPSPGARARRPARPRSPGGPRRSRPRCRAAHPRPPPSSAIASKPSAGTTLAPPTRAVGRNDTTHPATWYIGSTCKRPVGVPQARCRQRTDGADRGEDRPVRQHHGAIAAPPGRGWRGPRRARRDAPAGPPSPATSGRAPQRRW